ncbi:MAG TPA: GGDEF domain-containing protein [Pseudonocardiaceae bacterium]
MVMTAAKQPPSSAATFRATSRLVALSGMPGWMRYLVGVGVVVAGYYLLPMVGAAGNQLQLITYASVSGSAVVALLVGVHRNRPLRRSPWLLLAAGQLLTTAGEVVFDVNHRILGNTAEVSMADPLYLAAYPMLAAGLMMMVRLRTPGWDMPSIIDAAIVAISAALLSWMFLISLSALAADTTPLSRVVASAYPVMDLLLLTIAARLMLGAGSRAASFRLLSAGLILLLLSDTGYGVQTVLGGYRNGNLLDAGWLMAAALVGAAGLHPSMPKVTEHSPAAGPEATAGRLTVLAVAALLAPAALLTQYLRDEPMYLPLATGACMALFLLVITRMAGLVAAQRHMAITDPLTGLRTRRFLTQVLETEVARAHRNGTAVGLLLVDIDHFKHVNDTHGHHGGDQVLVEVANRLAALVRSGDVIARYGGEEFAVLLPQASAAALTAAAERVRHGIASTPFAVDMNELITVTVSVGGALLPGHVRTLADLTISADRALYAAKRAGRNRVVTTEDRTTDGLAQRSEPATAPAVPSNTR